MSDSVRRTWPVEPWHNCDGDDCGNPLCEGVYFAEEPLDDNYKGTGVFSAAVTPEEARAAAERTVECVNAMRGVSAPEGAVARLTEAMRRLPRYPPLSSNVAAMLDFSRDLEKALDALAEFSLVEEPS